MDTDLIIQQQAEKIADLEADLKTTKQIFTDMAAMVGMVNPDGSLNENVKIKHIIGEVGHIMTTAMMPFSDKSELEKKFAFLKQIIPIYEKYKHL